MLKILFVCLGNVGRSQMAEAYYNHFTNSNNARSAGTDPTTPSRYECPTKEIIQVMNEENIDVSQKKVKTLKKQMVEEADHIYVICKKEQCPEYLLSSTKTTYWVIEDPYQMNVERSKEIRELIKEKVLSII